MNDRLVEYLPTSTANLREGGAFGWLDITSMMAVARPELPRVAGGVAHRAELGATELQAARLAALGELAASLAHELNNALGTITLRLEGLLAGCQEQGARRHALEVVARETERMADLVANMLESSRADHSRTTTTDACDEVTGAVELTRPRLSRAGVRVTTNFARGIPLVRADHSQIRQVLLNLFNNAADAMPDGGRLTIRVRPGKLTHNRPAVAIEVADTGTGIAPDVLPRVTETFFTTKTDGKGTGLGLAICKRIVDAHGGELLITSRHGSGTTVRVTLPASREDSLDCYESDHIDAME